jgi:hypothetical protein
MLPARHAQVRMHIHQSRQNQISHKNLAAIRQKKARSKDRARNQQELLLTLFPGAIFPTIIDETSPGSRW